MLDRLNVTLDGVTVLTKKVLPHLLEEVDLAVRARRTGSTLTVNFLSQQAIPDYVRYVVDIDGDGDPFIEAIGGPDLYYEHEPQAAVAGVSPLLRGDVSFGSPGPRGWCHRLQPAQVSASIP